jgi:hypothetical protein
MGAMQSLRSAWGSSASSTARSRAPGSTSGGGGLQVSICMHATSQYVHACCEFLCQHPILSMQKRLLKRMVLRPY